MQSMHYYAYTLFKNLFVKLLLRYQGPMIKISIFSAGRLGNNIQQLLIAYVYRVHYGCSVEFQESIISNLIDSPYYNLLGAIGSNTHKYMRPLITLSGPFFDISLANTLFRLDCLHLPRQVIYQNIHPFSTYLSKSLKLSTKALSEYSPPISKSLIDPKCVTIHLRAGDLSTPDYHYYVSNPFSFYQYLRTIFNDCIIVTQPGDRHPLFTRIINIFETVNVQSSSNPIDDLSLLSSSSYIASSGTSSFFTLACLSSSQPQHLFYSSYEFHHHIPFRWIPAQSHNIFYLSEKYIQTWTSPNTTPSDRIQLMLNT